jgi:hypothetical protein
MLKESEKGIKKDLIIIKSFFIPFSDNSDNFEIS